MTKGQQRELLSKAIGAAFALRSTSGSTPGSAGVVSTGFTPTTDDDTLLLAEGEAGDLSCACASNTDTGFYFPDGKGFAVVIDGEEVASFTSEGVILKGNVSVGDEGTEDSSSELLSNVIGTTVSAAGTWANLRGIEFATFPLKADAPTGFYVFLSEDNGTVSRSEKVYFFSLRGQTGVSHFMCQPSFQSEAGPTYWDIFIKVDSLVATFYVRRFNSSSTTSTADCRINVAIVSEAIGSIQVKRPTVDLNLAFTNKGFTGGQSTKKVIIDDPTITGFNAFTTKQNGQNATGGTVTGTAQDKTSFSMPSASPARSNGVTTENTTDVYVPRVRYFAAGTDSEKIYDWLWTNERFAPNHVPNDAGTSAHQNKMGTGTATQQTFVWPAAAPANGTYLLQSVYSGGQHTLSYVSSSTVVSNGLPQNATFSVGVSSAKFTQTSSAASDESLFKRLAVDTGFFTSTLNLGWNAAQIGTATSATGSTDATPPVLPANPAGFIQATVNGAAVRIPYYNA